jgi:hypothetical protein
MLPRLAKRLTISLEALVGEDASPATPIPQRRSKRGPPSRLEQQFNAIAQLPKAEQRFVSKMLDNALAGQAR